MQPRLNFSFLIVGIIILRCQTTLAATSTSTFNVTASIAAACSVAASDLTFGAYTFASNLLGTTTINTTCTNGTTYNIGLNQGTSPGATTSTRKLVNGANTLNYFLYSDAGRTVNWGNNVGVDTLAATGSGVAQPSTVYASVLSGQTDAAPGSYSDTITVTVTF